MKYLAGMSLLINLLLPISLAFLMGLWVVLLAPFTVTVDIALMNLIYELDCKERRQHNER